MAIIMPAWRSFLTGKTTLAEGKQGGAHYRWAVSTTPPLPTDQKVISSTISTFGFWRPRLLPCRLQVQLITDKLRLLPLHT